MKNSLFYILFGICLGLLLELWLEAARKQFREPSEIIMETEQ